MKFGYIHSNKEEQTKALQVLKLTSESVALDELGIGRIRDAFADRMFPGISTLQKHLKYFSLMPQLYKKATERRYNCISEVRTEIIRLEKIMTRNLYEGSSIKWGITGSDMISKGVNNYVKYDPAYIYNSGLQTFEILRSPQLYELIYSSSKSLHNSPNTYYTEDEDTANDSVEKAGLFQFCSFPSVEYDFTEKCSLDLTKADKSFIVEHILKANACKGTLLRFLVDNESFTLPQKFDGFIYKSLPEGLAELQDFARKFADFIYLVHVRYNYIFSEYKDDKMLEEFNELVEQYNSSETDINAVLSTISVRDDSSKEFCKAVEGCISTYPNDGYNKLDQLIINREKRVKGSRRKIGNPSYVYDSNNRIHYYKLTYRWETVRQFIEELRKETENG